MGNFFKYAAVFAAGMGVGAGVTYGYDKYHDNDTPSSECDSVETEDPRDDIGDPPDPEVEE